MVMKSATDKSLGSRKTQVFWVLLSISDPVEGKKLRWMKEKKIYVYFKGKQHITVFYFYHISSVSLDWAMVIFMIAGVG